jgi:hypothetical protein
LPLTCSHTISDPSPASATLATPLTMPEDFRSSLRNAAKPRIVPHVACSVIASMILAYVDFRRVSTSLRCRRMTAS